MRSAWLGIACLLVDRVDWLIGWLSVFWVLFLNQDFLGLLAVL